MLFRSSIEMKESYARLEGTCVQLDTQWICNTPSNFDPLKLPKPDRSHFYRYRNKFKYLYYGECALVKTAYGCPYNCSFCYCRLLNGEQYNCRAIEDVLDEIEGLDCNTVWIVDDTFLIDPNRIKRMAEGIKIRGIHKRFIIYGRADFICENDEILQVLKDMGVVDIIVGLEAVKDEMLAQYNKEYSSDVNIGCIEILRKYGIQCTGLFMVHPNDTLEDFDHLNRWIEKNQLSVGSISIFTPLPGTVLYKEYEDRLGVVKYEDLDFLHLILPPQNMGKLSFYYQFYLIYLKLIWKNRSRLIHMFKN